MNNIMPLGQHAMVASPHYLATQVGSRILQQGGNAFDASVAISAALGVVYPHMTGLGGDAFFLVYDAKGKQLLGLNGSGRSGKQLTPELYVSRSMDCIPQRGVQSAITVPGMVDAWWEISSRFGRLPWAQLLEPAVAFAAKGFPISRNLYEWMCKDEALIRANPLLAAVYMYNDQLLAIGDRLLQPDLAATLLMIQAEGRDAFYSGAVMKSIVEAVQQDGGWLQEEDFQSHRSEWVKPLSVTYRGYDICQMPPNSQGFSVLMMMNILEHTDFSAIERYSAQFYHLMVEVIKKAFRDRDRYLTDPEFMQVPLDMLLSKAYAEQLYQEMMSNLTLADPFKSHAMGQDTAYAAVVDEEGNAVSFIQSLYFDFGSAYVAGTTGVLMQNRGSFFSLDPQKPNVLQPRKRSFHTLMPGMVLRHGKPYMLMGTQGGEGQPQTQLSLLTGVLDYGCSIQEAIALPRWVYGRTWGHSSDSLKIENRNLDTVFEELRQWGHDVESLAGWDGLMGQAQGIVINEKGVISGAADPRGDGMAIGW
jgi:gamma-glutamyltranspeptidase/glutathione hydrolase